MLNSFLMLPHKPKRTTSPLLVLTSKPSSLEGIQWHRHVSHCRLAWLAKAAPQRASSDSDELAKICRSWPKDPGSWPADLPAAVTSVFTRLTRQVLMLRLPTILWCVITKVLLSNRKNCPLSEPCGWHQSSGRFVVSVSELISGPTMQCPLMESIWRIGCRRHAQTVPCFFPP